LIFRLLRIFGSTIKRKVRKKLINYKAEQEFHQKLLQNSANSKKNIEKSVASLFSFNAWSNVDRFCSKKIGQNDRNRNKCAWVFDIWSENPGIRISLYTSLKQGSPTESTKISKPTMIRAKQYKKEPEMRNEALELWS
jgi:hypothetical protein